jgi:hypothetical protein
MYQGETLVIRNKQIPARERERGREREGEGERAREGGRGREREGEGERSARETFSQETKMIGGTSVWHQQDPRLERRGT